LARSIKKHPAKTLVKYTDMRKLIVSMNISLDGFMAGSEGELNWHFDYWNEELAQFACEQLSNIDTIILGRNTYEAMASYWETQTGLALERGDLAFGDMINSCRKIVFSHRRKTAKWNNTRVVRENMRSEILKLKEERSRKSIIVYGSGSIVASLMQLNLVDELVLWMHPVILSEGKSFFGSLHKRHALHLLDTKKFSSGVLVLHYEVNDCLNKKNFLYGKVFLER
jgi:dihydrofolate reductase